MRQRRTYVLVVGAAMLACSGSLSFGPAGKVSFSLTAAVQAQEEWRAELETLCARTEDAMTFSREELKALVERCDKLKPRIEALDETARKVYGKRLQMCRDFYHFMLENKKAEGGGK